MQPPTYPSRTHWSEDFPRPVTTRTENVELSPSDGTTVMEPIRPLAASQWSVVVSGKASSSCSVDETAMLVFRTSAHIASVDTSRLTWAGSWQPLMQIGPANTTQPRIRAVRDTAARRRVITASLPAYPL